MDPKVASQLDPKLQQAYDRVMGVALNTPASANALPGDPTQAPTPVVPPPDPTMPTTPATNPLPQLIEQLPTPTPPTPTPPSLPIVEPVAPAMPTVAPMPAPVEMPQPEKSTVENTVSVKPSVFVAKNGGSAKISPIIMALGAIIFLLVYTLVWVKVFNLPIPFINQ